MSPTELRNAIKKVRERTAAPFGVNLRADAADAAEQVGLIISEQVPVASFAQAPTRDFIGRLRDAGVITVASVGARRHAEKVAAWGIDAVIAIGAEGGGHVGAVPTSLLVPQVVDAVEVPVIAAGGGLTWGQVLMAANTPVLLRAAMADGRPEAGLMPSGQVAGLIDDLPTCAELITRIMTDAEQRLAALGKLSGPGS
jgi:NAD(P)H-dependent flavin oxidoreductase YrpB (nitropropane dioxygenase family)